MSAISYKCPNCGGELTFDPKTQKFQCEYCVSWFEENEVEGKDSRETEQEKSAADHEQEAAVYSCPSCGAEIVTDETTAATFCYYCHNPIVLQGRLSKEFLPDQVLPFEIDRKGAEEDFLSYVKKKRFVPHAFFDKKQIEMLTGVYFPYWTCECQVKGSLDAKGTKVRVWRAGDIEYTETKFYEVARSGDLKFEEVTRNALEKANRELVEGVQPFPIKNCKDFSMGYLSGFQAEKRDQEKECFHHEIMEEVKDYSKKLLRDTINGYSSVTLKDTRIHVEDMKWNYLLLPVWTLTYRGKNEKIYYYALNGITGKVCGKLPIDYKKVGITAFLVFLLVFLLCLLGGYYL